MVVSMFCLAPYAPKQLWYFAWMHAIDLINMRPSHIPGSNKGRYEEFTGLVPDFNSIILLPWAIPIRFHNAFHKGLFAPLNYTGMYMGRTINSPHSIDVWTPLTKKI